MAIGSRRSCRARGGRTGVAQPFDRKCCCCARLRGVLAQSLVHADLCEEPYKARIATKQIGPESSCQFRSMLAPDVAVLSSGQQISFPVTRNRSIFRFCGSFADRDGIDDLPAAMSMFAGMTRAAHAPLRAQMVQQLFFQRSPRLNEQAAINRLVGHAHALVV